MILMSRKNDAIISVCQDNQNSRIEIQEINAACEHLIGYNKDELSGKSLHSILPPTSQEVLDSYIEYEDGGKDLASVLGKTRKFQLLHQKGTAIPVNVKVFYVVAANKNLHFELLLRDSSFTEQMEELRESLHDDRDTLPLLPAFNSYAKFISSAVAEARISANLILLSLGDAATLSELPPATLSVILKEVNDRYHMASRIDDAIGYIGNYKLGIILVDCANDALDNVIARICSRINRAPFSLPDGTSMTLSLDVTVHTITPSTSVTQLIENYL